MDYFEQDCEEIYEALNGIYTRGGVYAFSMKEISYKSGMPSYVVNIVGHKKEDVPTLVKKGWRLQKVIKEKNVICLYNDGEVPYD